MTKKQLTEELEWAIGQLMYYLPNRLDTEASKVWDRAVATSNTLLKAKTK